MKYFRIYFYVFIALLFLGMTQGYAQEKKIGISFTNINASSNDSDIWHFIDSNSKFSQSQTKITRVNLGLVYTFKSYDLRLLFSNEIRKSKHETQDWNDTSIIDMSENKNNRSNIGLSFSKIYDLNLNKRFALHFGPNGQIYYYFKGKSITTRTGTVSSLNDLYSIYQLTHNSYLSYKLGLQISLSYKFKRGCPLNSVC